ncbi:MAG: hypothetical protein JRJ00_01270 [Deltaproteobacteria bacterium]|nr:hypothetical protein [Deltaproteobacteria bacterium]
MSWNVILNYSKPVSIVCLQMVVDKFDKKLRDTLSNIILLVSSIIDICGCHITQGFVVTFNS